MESGNVCRFHGLESGLFKGLLSTFKDKYFGRCNFQLSDPQFFYAFSGHHQIKMNEGDQVHILFQAAGKIFCYNAIPFNLKNAGATYQKMVDKVFKK